MSTNVLHDIYCDALPDVDLVLIHGLGGHAIKSWSTDDAKMWAADFLPSDLHPLRLRVLAYQYPATLRMFQSLDNSPGCLSVEAKNLVASFLDARKDPERPLIVLCHDLGGSLFKQTKALLQIFSSLRSGESPATDLIRSLYAIVFFGTPHSIFDTSQDFLRRLMRLHHLTNPRQYVEPANESVFLPLAHTIGVVNDRFERFWPYFRICFVHVEVRTDAHGCYDVLFPAHSTCPDVSGSRRLVLRQQHFDMVRFADSQCASYRSVAVVLRHYARAAHILAMKSNAARSTGGAKPMLILEQLIRQKSGQAHSLLAGDCLSGRPPHYSPYSKTSSSRLRASTPPQDVFTSSIVRGFTVVSQPAVRESAKEVSHASSFARDLSPAHLPRSMAQGTVFQTSATPRGRRASAGQVLESAPRNYRSHVHKDSFPITFPASTNEDDLSHF